MAGSGAAADTRDANILIIRIYVSIVNAQYMVPMKFYQKDRRVMSVMIELNRRLYMNRQGEIHIGYDRVKADISELIMPCKSVFYQIFFLPFYICVAHDRIIQIEVCTRMR